MGLNLPNAANTSPPGMANASAWVCASALVSGDDSRDSAIALVISWLCSAGVISG